MWINSNHELMVFNNGYSLGFRAGQLEQRRLTIETTQRIEAETAGHYIAVTRKHVSLDEYSQYTKSDPKEK